jgi:hypothetical protein
MNLNDKIVNKKSACLTSVVLSWLLVFCLIDNFVNENNNIIVTYGFFGILFLLPLIVICIFFFVTKEKEIRELVKKNSLLSICGAIFIDFMFSIFIFGIVSIAIAIINHIKLYYYFVSLFIVIVLSLNVFFTSPGFKIMGICCRRFQFPILINNAFYIFTLFFVVAVNKIWLYIIIGLYAGLDSFFIAIKKKPFAFFVFKIDIFSCFKKMRRTGW